MLPAGRDTCLVSGRALAEMESKNGALLFPIAYTAVHIQTRPVAVARASGDARGAGIAPRTHATLRRTLRRDFTPPPSSRPAVQLSDASRAVHRAHDGIGDRDRRIRMDRDAEAGLTVAYTATDERRRIAARRDGRFEPVHARFDAQCRRDRLRPDTTASRAPCGATQTRRPNTDNVEASTRETGPPASKYSRLKRAQTASPLISSPDASASACMA